MAVLFHRSYLLSLIIFSASIGMATSGEAFLYSDPINHCTLTFPAEWEAIPKQLLNEINESLAAQGVLDVHFHAGFQLKTKPFEYPRVFLNYRNGKPASLVQIHKSVGDDKRKMELESAAKLPMIEPKTKIYEPSIDEKKGLVLYNMQVDGGRGNTVKSLIAVIPGRAGITQVNCYALNSEYDNYSPTFNAIIESFRYTDGDESETSVRDIHRGQVIWGGHDIGYSRRSHDSTGEKT
jgi:hypothetical protein